MEHVLIKKKLIPKHLLPYFRLKKSNRWILRNKIVWWKRNAMPSSAKDRFSMDWESVFFFVTSKRYYFQQQFEPFAESYLATLDYKRKSKKAGVAGGMSIENQFKAFQKAKNAEGRNKRCVWDIPTSGFARAHFATFPEDLVIPMVKSGCPPGGIVLDPFSGSGTTCLVAKKLDRQYVGLEMNTEYVKMAERRIEIEAGTLI